MFPMPWGWKEKEIKRITLKGTGLEDAKIRSGNRTKMPESGRRDWDSRGLGEKRNQ